MLSKIDSKLEAPEALGNVTNVYEGLVFDHVLKVGRDLSPLAQADVACIALNKLPTKYVRQPVDWLFFLSTAERERIERAVDMAVTNAIARVLDNPPLQQETG